MAGFNFLQRYNRTVGSAMQPASAADLADIVDTSGAFSQIPAVQTATGASGVRVAHGSGTLVTGTLIVATGLSTVVGFTATVIQPATGTYLTGASEVHSINVVSITTGAVSVQGVFNAFVTGAATKSASGTATFYWIAFGT